MNSKWARRFPNNWSPNVALTMIKPLASRWVVMAAVAAGSVLLFAQSGLAVKFVPLGDLPGGRFESDAWGVSGDGRVVVGVSGSSNGAEEAFRWTAEEGMIGLGDLPGDRFDSQAYAASFDGSVIVGRGTNVESRSEVFRWTEENGMIGLGLRDGFGRADVSADGTVIASGEGYWTEEEGIIPLRGPDVGFEWDGVFTRAVSADGRVVAGYLLEGDTNPVPFRWSAETDSEVLSRKPAKC